MKLVFVVGPTASGKSHFALEAAAHLNAQSIKSEIMNCDSLQVYKSVDIGTAKPTKEEMARVPHLLFDFVNEGSVLTAGDYRKLALETIENRKREGVEVLFIVGGSGFYFHALEFGMFDLGKVPNEIHDQVMQDSRDSLDKLYQELKENDPEYAKKISANDSYRIQRAVEIIRTFGDSPSKMRLRFKQESLPYCITKFGFTRQRSELKLLIEERAKRMLQQGLIGETQAHLDKGLEGWPPLASVGYKETVQFIKNQISETELFDLMVQNTMRLAKKQMTWFKRDQSIKWFDSKTEMARAFDTLASELSRQS